MGRATAWHSVYRPVYHRPAHADQWVYASEWASPSVVVLYPHCKVCKDSMCSLVMWSDTAFWLCKAVVRELLYNMYNEARRYHLATESQSADVIVNRTIPRRWPSIETTRINVTCLLVYRAYILKCSEMWRPRFCVCWLVRKIYLVLWSA